jgi:hypothetical protein
MCRSEPQLVFSAGRIVFFHIRFFSISFPTHCATPPRCLAAEPPSHHAFLE